MATRRWVKGKALETLLALRPIQSGDEVLVSFEGLSYTTYPTVPQYERVPFIVSRRDRDSIVGDFARSIPRCGLDRYGWSFYLNRVYDWRHKRG